MSDPPAWAQQLFAPLLASVQRLQEQQQVLSDRFEALTLGSAVPPLPEVLSAEALQALINHPFLSDSDRPFARLLLRCLPGAMTDEDTELFKQCYDELRGRVLAAQDAVGESLPTPVSQNSRTAPTADPCVYVSRRGREYDTRLPPPYPCNRCHTMHWSLTPCPSPPPGPSHSQSHGYYHRNSRGGPSRPAQAPSAPAGQPHRNRSSSR